MHDIEPHFNWRIKYISEEDEKSPFYGKEYSEFFFSEAVYDHYIHPQWDNMGSPTLFIKILYVDYELGFSIIEMIGEWNDAIHNDIMILKRDIAEHMMYHGINKFILIGENVLNFHTSDDCYYEEWFDEVEEGWIALVNFRPYILTEFTSADLDQYFVMGGKLDEVDWRSQEPKDFFEKINNLVTKRLE